MSNNTLYVIIVLFLTKYFFILLIILSEEKNMFLSDKKNNFDYTRKLGKAYDEMKNAHNHSFYEFYYLLSGTRKFFINDTIYTVKRGDLIIIPKGAIHRTTYICDETHERIIMKFNDDYISNICTQVGKDTIERFLSCTKQITIPPNKRDAIEALLDKIENEHNGIDSLSPTMLKVFFEEFLLSVMRCQNSSEMLVSEDKICDDVISEAAKFISTHYDQQITLNQVADKFNMSPSYFSRKFKLCTGFGYKEYLITIRILESCNLLSTTNMPITEIAAKCGFEDSNYFGDSFKKINGISPREYRKNKMQK